MYNFLKKPIKRLFDSFGYTLVKNSCFCDLLQSKKEEALLPSYWQPCVANFDSPTVVMDEYASLYDNNVGHRAGAFGTDVLRAIEAILPSSIDNSAETGCGKSTILFSNISKHHKIFAFDDRTSGQGSSVLFYENCPLTRSERIETVFGATQLTLPQYTAHPEYDVVLLDGPHGYPFPDFEYLAFYPHIKKGGYLIIDDVHIPSIGRMVDIVAEDEMFELVSVVFTTAVLRRTDAETFDPYGDGWYKQIYNRRRVSEKRDIYLDTGNNVVDMISSLNIDKRI
jgi:hypothetical protein